MVDFIIPPPPKEEERGGFKIPPPPDVDDKAIQNIASDGFIIPPTPEQITENDGKLSEAELKKDPEWIKVAKSIYEFNEGTTFGIEKDGQPKKLNSDKEYANYALRYMGWFNYNIPKMGNEALDLFEFANQQQKEDFVTAMDMYDNKKISWSGVGRFIKGVGFDPSTYVGIGTLGAGLVARAGAKEATKQSIKEFVKQGAIQGAKIGAIEGATYSTVDNALRQSTRIMSGQREGFDFGESGQSALFGAGLGGVFGSSIGGTAAYFKNKGNVVPNVTDETEEFIVPPAQEVVDTPVAPEVVTPKVDIDTWNTLSQEQKEQLVPQNALNRDFDDDELFEIIDDQIIPNFSKKEFRETVPSKYGINENGVVTNPESFKIQLPKSYGDTIKINYIKINDRYLLSDNGKPSVQDDIFVDSIQELKDYLINKSLNKYNNPVGYKSDSWNKNIRPKILKKLQEQTTTPVTPKVETPKRGTKIPEILKVTKEPKVRTATDYIGKIKDGERSGELKGIFEDVSGNIQRKFKAGQNQEGNTLDDLDDVANSMMEDGFYSQVDTSDTGMTNRVLEDLNNNTPHPEDAAIYAEWQRKTDEGKKVRKVLDDNKVNYKGMTNEEVMQTYDDIVNDRLPPVRDEVPLEMYADDIEAASGGNINNVRVDDIVDPTPDGRDFQTDTTVDLNDRLVEVGVKIMDDLEIPRNPEIKISDQLEEVLFQAEGNPVAREKLDSVLEKNNITLPELSQLFRGSIADSARRMQKLSAVSRSIQNLSEKIGKTAKPETWTARLYNFIKQADNIRRGLLVSQIATAMRNNTAQLGRVSMKTMIDVFDNTLKKTFNPIRKAFGAEEAPVDYARSFELILNLTKNKKQAKDLTDLLTKYYVKDAENLFTRYSSDVADATKTSNAARIIKVGQKVTDGLNILNRMQEFWYRRAVFANTITDALLKKGIDINKVGISDDLLKYVNKADIEKAVDDALYFTYAKTPDVPIVKSLVDAVNSMPFFATGIIPFPRFMANAIAFQFRHSPLGFSALLTPKEIAKLKAGDYKTLSQAVVGTTLLLTAVEMKRRGSETNKWYEVETSSGKTVDMRPYFPLTPYLLVADMVVRSESGRGAPDAKDVLQGLSGAQFRAGASVQLVQNLLDGMAGLDTEEKVNRFMSDYTANVLGGYMTPIRMFGDFLDQDQQFRRPLPTGEFLDDTTNQLKSNIPFVRDQFPESESPTREAAPGRPDTVQIPFTEIEAPGPLVRQLTGATVREEKNAAEKEFDRLGFKRRDILPYSGNAVVDQTRAKYLGPIVEKVIPVLIQSEQYQSASNELKSTILRKTLTELRSAANDYIKENRINEEQFAKAAFNRQPKYIKALLNSQGITSKTFLENYDTQVGEDR